MGSKRSIKALSRDCQLDMLAEARADLIAEAREIAEIIFRMKGRVTAPQVLSAMRELDETGLRLGIVDPRFMGAVFRRGWKRIGFEPAGSHARPVSIWTKDEAA